MDLSGGEGVNGANGLDGKDGADGKDGVDGKSVYEFAVENRYKGIAFWKREFCVTVRRTRDCRRSSSSGSPYPARYAGTPVILLFQTEKRNSKIL